jgi:hypothetical protein
MNKITSTEELNAAILQLENRQMIQEQLLKEQLQFVYTSLKPINIIKNTIREAISSTEIHDDIIEYLGNLAADYVTELFTKGSSGNFVKKYLGQILHYGITAIIKLNTKTIRSIGESLANIFWGENKKQKS